MSNSLWRYGLDPTKLLCPWDFPGKNTGVGSHSYPRARTQVSHIQVDSLLSEPPGKQGSVKRARLGTSLVVQWLRLHAPDAGSQFNTWSRNETSHATAKTWHSQINFFKKKKLVIETTTLMYTSQDHLALKSCTSSRKHSHPRFPWLSGFSPPTFMPSLGRYHHISSLPLPSLL